MDIFFSGLNYSIEINCIYICEQELECILVDWQETFLIPDAKQ